MATCLNCSFTFTYQPLNNDSTILTKLKPLAETLKTQLNPYGFETFLLSGVFFYYYIFFLTLIHKSIHSIDSCFLCQDCHNKKEVLCKKTFTPK